MNWNTSFLPTIWSIIIYLYAKSIRIPQSDGSPRYFVTRSANFQPVWVASRALLFSPGWFPTRHWWDALSGSEKWRLPWVSDGFFLVLRWKLYGKLWPIPVLLWTKGKVESCWICVKGESRWILSGVSREQGMIIPIDFHIFQRGGSTTNQYSYNLFH